MKQFLTAEWKKLVFVNYIIDPEILKPYLPQKTELDYFNGNCYVSVVAFLFANTKLRGLGVPFHKNFEEYHRLKELGFHLQVNLLSLTGYYGKTVARAAKYIIDKNLAVLVGTDLHHERHLAALLNRDNRKLFDKYLSAKKYNALDELI